MDVKIGRKGASDKDMLVLTSGLTMYLVNQLGISPYYSVNNITISESRNYVEHTMPGRKGSVFQDMGRPAVKVVVDGNISEEGIILGWRKGGGKLMLEELHKLCDEGKPLDFYSDMPTLFGISRVIIQEMEATEVKGRKHNYNYKLTLKEWSEEDHAPKRAALLESLKKDAWKEFAKKALVLAATGAAAGTYIGVTTAKKAEALTVAVKAAKGVITVKESVEIKASVNDAKGNPVVDADLTITQASDSKQLFSGKTNADGEAVATFEGPEDSSGFKNYELKATAKKSGFSDGEASGFVTVDSRLRAKATVDSVTIKAGEKATITVTVTDCNNKAVEGASIAMEESTKKLDISQADKATNADGASTATASSSDKATYTVAIAASKSSYVDGKASVKISVG